jgi:C_GCAxxG_C_C family probable redox protein
MDRRGKRVSAEDLARQLFNSGYNCAESVLLVVSGECGLAFSGGQSLIPRIATGFGGGIARNGNICGALAGGVMAIGLALGRDRPEESRDPCYRAADRFYNEFVGTFGTCGCRELTGVDLKTAEGRKAHQDRIHNERCNPIVAWAARTACQIVREA